MIQTSSSKKKVTFNILSIPDRNDTFKLLCQAVNITLADGKKKVNGKQIGLQHLMDFSRLYKLTISVNFEQSIASIIYTEFSREEVETTEDKVSNFELEGVEREKIKPLEQGIDPIPHIPSKDTSKEETEEEEEEEDEDSMNIENDVLDEVPDEDLELNLGLDEEPDTIASTEEDFEDDEIDTNLNFEEDDEEFML